jgi:hypothetical protein
MSDAPKLNQTVTTPNGPAQVIGPMYEGGQKYILVRHPKPITDSKAGRPATNTSRALWVYLEGDIRTA